MTSGGIILCGGKSRRMGRPKAMLPFGPETMLQRVVRLLSQAVEPIVVVATPGQQLPELPPSIILAHDRQPDRGPLEGLAVGLRTLADRAPEGGECRMVNGEGRGEKRGDGSRERAEGPGSRPLSPVAPRSRLVPHPSPLAPRPSTLAPRPSLLVAAFVTGCDVPLLKPALVRRMIDLSGGYQIAVPHLGGFDEPLTAVYCLSVLPQVEALLCAGRLRPAYLFDQVRTRRVAADELADIDPELQSLVNVNTSEDYRALLQRAGFPHQSAGSGGWNSKTPEGD